MAKEKRWRSLLAEFVVIVVGVLVALGVDDFRDAREDQRLEVYLINRLSDDLERDFEDLDRVILRAERRVWLANAFLQGIGDPFAEEMVPYPERGEDGTLHDPGANPWTELSIWTDFDLSDATYVEASATGSLGVVQNPELRQAVANYYFRARDFQAVDERSGRSQERLLDAFQRVGLAPSDPLSLNEMIERIAGDPTLAVEIRRFRYHVREQLRYYRYSRADAEELRAVLDEAG